MYVIIDIWKVRFCWNS